MFFKVRPNTDQEDESKMSDSSQDVNSNNVNKHHNKKNDKIQEQNSQNTISDIISEEDN